MSTGTITVGETPCCGLVERTYDASRDASSSTGMWHSPGGEYAPSFALVAAQIQRGICPGCGKRFGPDRSSEDEQIRALRADEGTSQFPRMP